MPNEESQGLKLLKRRSGVKLDPWVGCPRAGETAIGPYFGNRRVRNQTGAGPGPDAGVNHSKANTECHDRDNFGCDEPPSPLNTWLWGPVWPFAAGARG